MNAALPLSIIKFKLRCVPFVQAAEKWWMQLLQLGQLIGDWKLQLYAQDQSILHERYHIMFVSNKPEQSCCCLKSFFVFLIVFPELANKNIEVGSQRSKPRSSPEACIDSGRDTVL